MKRLNAAISESFLKSKNKQAKEEAKQEHIRNSAEPSSIRKSIKAINKGDKKPIIDETVENKAEEVLFDSSENKISSNVEPIIITSTSISISLEENVVPYVTSTSKPKKSDSKFSPPTTSTVASSSTLKPKITKGRLIAL